MIWRHRLKAGAISTVLVVSTLMLLMLLALMLLWDADFVMFSRTNYMRRQRANIESLFTLYMNDPKILTQTETEKSVTLYESVPGSDMLIERRLWGLYELVRVASEYGRVAQTRMLGLSVPYKERCNLWYLDNRSSLTATGDTNLHGRLLLPQNGIVYGQMQSVFFSGETIERSNIARSSNRMPTILPYIRKHLEELSDKNGTYADNVLPDSMYVSFRDDVYTIRPDDGLVAGRILGGNIMVFGDKIHIDASSRLDDVLIIGNTITIGDGFTGSLQAFARDSVMIGESAALKYPSGIYARSYVEVGERTEVNGYVICDFAGEPDLKKPNGRMARTSKVRGLVWNSGIMQLQGIVSGAVFLNKAVYYAPHGYYQNMLYDATILENDIIAYPLWVDDNMRRRDAKWVN